MMKKIGNLRGLLDSWKEVSQTCDDLAELYEMSKDEESADLTKTIESDVADLRARVEKMEFKKMLNGPDDACSCLMSIHPGAGGTESQDWALMLFRMYTHFFERENMDFKVVDFQEAEDAGLKSATIEITCENAYGLLRSEIGVHRLVRMPAATRALPPCTCTRSTKTWNSTSTWPMCAWIPTAVAVPVASTSTRRIPRCA